MTPIRPLNFCCTSHKKAGRPPNGHHFPGNVDGQRAVHRLLPLEHKPHIDTFLLHVDSSAVALQLIESGERDGRQRIAWPSWPLQVRAGVSSCCLQCPTCRCTVRRATSIDNTGAIILLRGLVISSWPVPNEPQ